MTESINKCTKYTDVTCTCQTSMNFLQPSSDDDWIVCALRVMVF